VPERPIIVFDVIGKDLDAIADQLVEQYPAARALADRGADRP